MAKQDFAGAPEDQPDITGGGLGEDAGVVHMRAFLKAVKSGDPKAMWEAFQAGSSECSPDDYGASMPSDDDGDEMG